MQTIGQSEEALRRADVSRPHTWLLRVVIAASVVAASILVAPAQSHAVQGLFRIAPAMAPHKSIDLPGKACPYNAGNTPSSVTIYTHDNTCSTGDQRWWIQDMGNGEHEIRQGGSGGKCLDIDNAGNGTRVGTYTCVGTSNQRWILTETTAAGPDGLYGLWKIKSARDGRVLDLANWSTANDTPVAVWTDHGGLNQRWILWSNGGMRQDFADDFSGSSLNTSVWTAANMSPGRFNQELQSYQPANVSVEGGFMHIDANYVGACNGGTGSGCYTSGRVNSKGKKFFRNGMFSARVRYIENGGGNMGTWPAFWLLGNSIDESPYDASYVPGSCWPMPGAREIDVWEWVRNNNGATYINNAIIGHGCQAPIHNPVDTPAWNWNDWIVTAVKIDGGRVKFYRQGIKTHDVPDTGFVNEDFSFIFNLAVGGMLGGANYDFNATYKWASMQVDWVAHETW